MISIPLKSTYFFLFFILFFGFISCAANMKELPLSNSNIQAKDSIVKQEIKDITVSSNKTDKYLPLLKGEKVGITANQTSVIFKSNGYTHLIDSLLKLNVNIVKVFTPEHGFRGTADAGETVKNDIDIKTNLPLISLYGKNKKPSPEQLQNIEVMLFDIQDVGVRFYTYISTLHYVMEACAENNIPLIVLDRPNPNGHYIDGPTLEMAHKSFVGMHPVPLVYGMTIGEYAKMINGESWLTGKIKCNLTVIPLSNYTHQKSYHLPIKPSPNLPNDIAINLYPSLGFLEGTPINAGRGTENQFQQYGAPFFPISNFSYTPKSNEGAKNPKHKNILCYGVDLKNTEKLSEVHIEWLIDAYQKTPKEISFFGSTFTIHAGTKNLENQLKNGFQAPEIRNSWKEDLKAFKKMRSKYLLYK